MSMSRRPRVDMERGDHQWVKELMHSPQLAEPTEFG